MTTTEILIVLATVSGPILAVQAQKWIERARETRRQKRHIFATLMATRATRLAQEHVQALNAIEMEFRGRSASDRAVVNAWRLYADKLNERFPETEAGVTAWGQQREALFIDLLEALSQALGYRFDRVQLMRGVYYPRGHGEKEEIERRILIGAVRVLAGEQPISMNVTSFPMSSEAAELNEKVQKGLLDCLTGKRAVHVSMKQEADSKK
jgi:hypothetical protein